MLFKLCQREANFIRGHVGVVWSVKYFFSPTSMIFSTISQGESGTSQIFGPFTSSDAAIKQFKSKFKDKTKNDCKMKKNNI